jgi:hypothetical protein
VNEKKSKMQSNREVDVRTLELSEFKPKSLPDHPFLLLAGIRRSGKTYLTRWLLKKLRKRFDRIFVLTGTKMSHQWDDLVGEQNIFDDHFETRIEALLAAQENIAKREDGNLPSILLLLDDVIGDDTLKPESHSLKRLATLGRHVHISCFLLVQHLHAFRPTIRNNCDAMVLFSQLSQKTMETVFEESLCGLHLTKRDLLSLYEQWAEGYRALVIWKAGCKTNKLKDRLKWVEAPAPRSSE